MVTQDSGKRKYEPSAYVFSVLDGRDAIGYITASAQRSMSPILEYSTATPPTKQFSTSDMAAKNRGMRTTGRPLYHGGVKYELELTSGHALNVRSKRVSLPKRMDAGKFQFDGNRARQKWKDVETVVDIDTSANKPPSGGGGGDVDQPSCGSCSHVSSVPCWTESDGGGADSTSFGTGKDSWQKWDGCSPISGSMIIAYHEGIGEWQDNERERIIDRLHETMNTGEGPIEGPGITSIEDVAPGFDNYTDGSKSYNGTLAVEYDKEYVLHELDQKSRPFQLSFMNGARAEDYPDSEKRYDDHSVTVVGQYNFVEELEIHDTWNQYTHRLTYGSWNESWCVSVEAN